MAPSGGSRTGSPASEMSVCLKNRRPCEYGSNSAKSCLRCVFSAYRGYLAFLHNCAISNETPFSGARRPEQSWLCYRVTSTSGIATLTSK